MFHMGTYQCPTLSTIVHFFPRPSAEHRIGSGEDCSWIRRQRTSQLRHHASSCASGSCLWSHSPLSSPWSCPAPLKRSVKSMWISGTCVLIPLSGFSLEDLNTLAWSSFLCTSAALKPPAPTEHLADSPCWVRWPQVKLWAQKREGSPQD